MGSLYKLCQKINQQKTKANNIISKRWTETDPMQVMQLRSSESKSKHEHPNGEGFLETQLNWKQKTQNFSPSVEAMTSMGCDLDDSCKKRGKNKLSQPQMEMSTKSGKERQKKS